MLAHGRLSWNGSQASNQLGISGAPSHANPVPAPAQTSNISPQMLSCTVAAKGVSKGNKGPRDIRPTKPLSKGKVKTTTAASNSRRKADDLPTKSLPSKKKKGDTCPVNGARAEESAGVGGEYGEGDNAKSKMTDEEQRKKFLQRNRIAAHKCRQRKKQWLANLHNNVEMYGSENNALTARITQLKLELVNLKTLLLAHKDCPVTQQQDLHRVFMSQEVEPFSTQLNPYRIAEPMINRPVMTEQEVRGYSSRHG